MHHFGKIDKKNLNAEKSYNRLKAYCNSKLAAIMFTKELAKRLVGTNVATYALHPGLVYTGIYRPTNIIIATLNKYVFPLFEFLFFKTAESGCQTYLYCAMDPDLRKESGKYYQ
jgi:retinol dehydrogenase-12